MNAEIHGADLRHQKLHMRIPKRYHSASNQRLAGFLQLAETIKVAPRNGLSAHQLRNGLHTCGKLPDQYSPLAIGCDLASIQKTQRGYRAQILHQGKRISKSFRTQREARVWAETTLTALRAEAGKTPADKYTLAEALTKYQHEVTPGKRGHRWERIRIDAFLRDPHLPTGEKIGALTTAHFALWRDHRLDSVQAGSVLREIAILSAVLETARADWRWIDHNPLRDLRKPRMPDHRTIVIQPRQLRQLLRAMGYSPRQPTTRTVAQSVAVCTLTALRTGMRAGELCGLTWDRVHPDYCRLPVTKTVPRDVPLTGKARRLIDKQRRYDPVSVFGLTPPTLDANFRKYRQRAGLDGFTFHDTRHTAATMLARRLHILDLCKMFGWTDARQAQVYYNPSASSIAKVLDAHSPR